MPFKDYQKERAWKKEQWKRWREKVLDVLGNICSHCPFSDPRALQIDHVHGGGCAEERLLGRGVGYMKHVIDSVMRGEGKYQLLCANCNVIKKVVNNELRRSGS